MSKCLSFPRGTVLILLIACTAYDVLYTLTNRKFRTTQNHFKKKGPEKNINSILFEYFLFELIFYQPFLMFSFYTNGMKLFANNTESKSSDAIECIHGIRALSSLYSSSLISNVRYATDSSTGLKSLWYEHSSKIFIFS